MNLKGKLKAITETVLRIFPMDGVARIRKNTLVDRGLEKEVRILARQLKEVLGKKAYDEKEVAEVSALIDKVFDPEKINEYLQLGVEKLYSKEDLSYLDKFAQTVIGRKIASAEAIETYDEEVFSVYQGEVSRVQADFQRSQLLSYIVILSGDMENVMAASLNGVAAINASAFKGMTSSEISAYQSILGSTEDVDEWFKDEFWESVTSIDALQESVSKMLGVIPDIVYWETAYLLKDFSNDELKALIKFLEMPIGQKYSRGMGYLMGYAIQKASHSFGAEVIGIIRESVLRRRGGFDGNGGDDVSFAG